MSVGTDGSVDGEVDRSPVSTDSREARPSNLVLSHKGDPCIYCGTEEDYVPPGICVGRLKQWAQTSINPDTTAVLTAAVAEIERLRAGSVAEARLMSRAADEIERLRACLPVETTGLLSQERHALYNAIQFCQEYKRRDHGGSSLWPDVTMLKWLQKLYDRSAVEPKSTQPPDSRGDAALWVLAWLAMKGGLGSDVHEVIEAVMEGRAEMRPNNKLHIEPRGAEKASECICPKRDTDDSIIYTHVACPTHALNGSANEGKS